jgi:lysophospholipase L1-like esterase
MVRGLGERSAVNTRTVVVPLLVTAVALAVVFSGSASALRQDARPQSYYLALGDSMAYGFQPTKVGRPPAAFDTGYVDRFAAQLRRRSPGIDVVNYGCPGESAVTFVRGGCPWLAEGRKLHDAYRGSQLQTALAFLRAHPGEVSPITLTLWGNDVPLPLSRNAKRAPRAIAAFAPRLRSILRQLRAAAGPRADLIVTGAWNPEADRLEEAEPLYRSLDAAIVRAAAPSRARVANMFAALNGRGHARAQQRRLCTLTFICSRGDPHPTDAGYRAMADAHFAASGYRK